MAASITTCLYRGRNFAKNPLLVQLVGFFLSFFFGFFHFLTKITMAVAMQFWLSFINTKLFRQMRLIEVKPKIQSGGIKCLGTESNQ